jgi:hypothetical protein
MSLGLCSRQVCLKHCPPAQPLPSLPERERAPGTARGENALLNGWFPCVRSLIRLLDGGTEGKALLDDALNRCSAMQVRPCASDHTSAV